MIQHKSNVNQAHWILPDKVKEEYIGHMNNH